MIWLGTATVYRPLAVIFPRDPHVLHKRLGPPHALWVVLAGCIMLAVRAFTVGSTVLTNRLWQHGEIPHDRWYEFIAHEHIRAILVSSVRVEFN